ncbi:hypothetical protein ACVNP1_12335 [Staphylococcus aureus]
MDTKEYMSTLTYGLNGNVTGDDTGKIGGLLVQMFRLVIH